MVDRIKLIRAKINQRHTLVAGELKVNESASLVNEEIDALRRIAANPKGPDLSQKPAGSILAMQEAKGAKVETGGAARAKLYSENWSTANLDDAIEKFAGSNPIVSNTDKGKRIYTNPNTGIQVVEDVNGNYFRIYDPSIKGKRAYLDLSGQVPNK